MFKVNHSLEDRTVSNLNLNLRDSQNLFHKFKVSKVSLPLLLGKHQPELLATSHSLLTMKLSLTKDLTAEVPTWELLRDALYILKQMIKRT
jgi:hypothetical protein